MKSLSERRELGIVRLPNGETEGRDPRKITRAEFEKLGHVPTPILKVIRAKCLDCNYTAMEVARCTAVDCPNWPYRLGINPLRESGSTEGRRRAMAIARAARKPKEAII